MSKEEHKTFEFAGLFAIGCTLLAKVLAMLREMQMASTLGATVESDAYNVAYLLVITIYGLFSSAFGNSLMPTAAKLYKDDKVQLKKTISNIIIISIVVMLLLIGMIHLVPSIFVTLLAAGVNAETEKLAAELVKISSWSLVFLIVNSTFTIVLRIYDRNLFPTAAGLLFPLPLLVTLFAGCNSPYVLIFANVVGYGLQCFALLIGCRCNTGYRFRPDLKHKDANLKPFFMLMPPMLFSSGLLQLNVLVDNQVASKFSVGSLTALSLGSKVNSLVYTVFSTALIQIIYASMSKAYARGDLDHFRKVIETQIKFILLFIIPSAVILQVFSTEIIEILFLRGSYTAENARIAGNVLKGYSLGLIFYVLRDICNCVYYSANDSKFPSIVASISIGINIFLNFVLSNILGIQGIAYATSIAAIFSVVLLFICVNKRVTKIKLMSAKSFTVIAVSVGVTAIFAVLLKHELAEFSVWMNMVAFVICFIIYYAVYFLLEKSIQVKFKVKGE